MLQIETVEARRAHVKDQVARRGSLRAGEEFLRPPARAANQQFDRVVHRDVVFDCEQDERMLPGALSIR